jgi:hypothetical protein
MCEYYLDYFLCLKGLNYVVEKLRLVYTELM